MSGGRKSNNGVEVPAPIKVNDVCTQFMVKEDGCMAERIQKREFSDKYTNNKMNRRTVRSDIPLAKSVRDEEEEKFRSRIQRQEMYNQEISRRDEEYAVSVTENELNEIERVNKMRDSKDSILAQQLLQQDYINDVLQRNRLESNDHEVARRLQHEESEKYEQRKQKKLLKKERSRLEKEQSDLLNSSKFAGLSLIKGQSKDRILRQDGKLEDTGDFNDFYIAPSREMNHLARRELQELQDQELARLLQDQEHKRSSRLKPTDLALMEDTDAALAAVLQKQEKLKADKYIARKEQKEGAHRGNQRDSFH